MRHWVTPNTKGGVTIDHGLRTPREGIAFTARPKIHSHSQIFRYGGSMFCLPHRPIFSDILDLCLHWVSVVRGLNIDTMHYTSEHKQRSWDVYFEKKITTNIIFGIYLGYVLGLRTKVFVGKTIKSIFQWIRDIQYQNIADSSTENTPNLSAQFVCPSPKDLDIIEKRLYWASLVRA